jgi:hypothetical protein
MSRKQAVEWGGTAFAMANTCHQKYRTRKLWALTMITHKLSILNSGHHSLANPKDTDRLPRLMRVSARSVLAKRKHLRKRRQQRLDQ